MTKAHQRTIFNTNKPAKVLFYITNYPFFDKICQFHIETHSLLSTGTDDKDIKTGNASYVSPLLMILESMNGMVDSIYKNTLYVFDRIENKNLKLRNPSFEEY